MRKVIIGQGVAGLEQRSQRNNLRLPRSLLKLVVVLGDAAGHGCGDLCDQGFVTVAYNLVNTWLSCNFRRGSLRIASGHQDPDTWICPSSLADVCPSLTVGLFRHAAGIQHEHTGGHQAIRLDEPLVRQVGRDGSAIGLACPAPEIFNVIFCHVISLTLPSAEHGTKRGSWVTSQLRPRTLHAASVPVGFCPAAT